MIFDTTGRMVSYRLSTRARYPIQLSVSPLLAGVTVGENDRLADRLLYDRARQVMILLRNNIVLNVRVQEAEARAVEAERQLAESQMKQSATVESRSGQPSFYGE